MVDLCVEVFAEQGFIDKTTKSKACRTTNKFVQISLLVTFVPYLSEPGRSTLNVLNYKYKYFPPGMYLSTSTFVFWEMYLSTFRVLSKCT